MRMKFVFFLRLIVKCLLVMFCDLIFKLGVCVLLSGLDEVVWEKFGRFGILFEIIMLVLSFCWMSCRIVGVKCGGWWRCFNWCMYCNIFIFVFFIFWRKSYFMVMCWWWNLLMVFCFWIIVISILMIMVSF